MPSEPKKLPPGVTLRTNPISRPYLAWLKIKKKFIYLGYYATPQEAGIIVDFVKYILWGFDPQQWKYSDRHRVRRPASAPPVVNLEEKVDVNLSWVLHKLNRYGYLNPETMRLRLVAYREIADKIAAGIVAGSE